MHRVLLRTDAAAALAFELEPMQPAVDQQQQIRKPGARTHALQLGGGRRIAELARCGVMPMNARSAPGAKMRHDGKMNVVLARLEALRLQLSPMELALYGSC